MAPTKTAKSNSIYECNCGIIVDYNTELHICECGIAMCPSCFDYNNVKENNYCCGECISKQNKQVQQEFSSYPTVKTAPWFNMILKSVGKSNTNDRILLLVIVKSDGRLEFTTHEYRGSDGSIDLGHYHTILDNAVIEFNNRANEEGAY